MISDPLVVYRWHDGAYLQIRPGMSWNDDLQANVIAWMFEFVKDGKLAASLRPNLSASSASLPFMAVGPSLEDDVDRSGPWLRGFLLQLRRSRLGYALLATKESVLLRVGPTWVSDERWDTRYDVARRHHVFSKTTKASDRPFLGVVPLLSLYKVASNVMNDRDTRWSARVGSGASSTTHGLAANWLPFEEVIDRVLEKYFVLPERDRESWESRNALRGVWVSPSEEEVEILLLLGESNPLLWPADQLYAWYLERRGP